MFHWNDERGTLNDERTKANLNGGFIVLRSSLRVQYSSFRTRVCSWESSQSPKLADGVRLLALVLETGERLETRGNITEALWPVVSNLWPILADVARNKKAPVL